MAYQIGDKVIINLDRNKKYGPPSVNKEMWELNGSIHTIGHISSNNYYVMKENTNWHWNDEMLLPYGKDLSEKTLHIISTSCPFTFETKLTEALDAGLVLTTLPINFPADLYSAVLTRPIKL